MIYLYVFLPLLLSIIISAYITPRIILISYKKRLFDSIDKRKVHKTITPRLGGVAFFPSFVLSVTLTLLMPYLIGYGNSTISITPPFLGMICSLVILYFVGIADDLLDLGYKNKFLAQVIAAMITVFSGVAINNLSGLLTIHELIYWITIPISILFLVFIINAINFIDGIDGLASGICGLAFLVLGIVFWQQTRLLYASVSFAAFGMLVPFFYYNVFTSNRYKIFMGDGGSLTIGYLLAFLVICLLNDGKPGVNVENYSYHFIIGGSLLLVPGLDAIRVMLNRIKRKVGIFYPDDNHLHHKFLEIGFSQKKALVSILIFACSIFIINLLIVRFLNINFILLIDVLLYTILIWYLSEKTKIII